MYVIYTLKAISIYNKGFTVRIIKATDKDISKKRL